MVADPDAPLRVTPECPLCGHPVVYNGNYFCSRRGCTWALDEAGQRAGLDHDYAALLAEGQIKRVAY